MLQESDRYDCGCKTNGHTRPQWADIYITGRVIQLLLLSHVVQCRPPHGEGSTSLASSESGLAHGVLHGETVYMREERVKSDGEYEDETQLNLEEVACHEVV